MNVDIDFLKGFMVGRAIGVRLAEIADLCKTQHFFLKKKRIKYE